MVASVADSPKRSRLKPLLNEGPRSLGRDAALSLLYIGPAASRPATRNSADVHGWSSPDRTALWVVQEAEDSPVNQNAKVKFGELHVTNSLT